MRTKLLLSALAGAGALVVWTVVINAFQIQDVGRQRHGVTAAHDSFSLRVSADGEALTR